MSNKLKYANDMVPGSATHPGVLIKEELRERGIKHIELAKKMCIAKNVMSEIINGKRNITPDLALKLESILEINAEFWMKLQVNYEIDLIRISKRAKNENSFIPDESIRKLETT